MNLNLSNGIIFGATGLVGSKISIEMAKKGCKLILHSKTKKKLEELNDKIVKIGRKPTLVNFNVEKYGNYKNLGSLLSQKFERIDFCINTIGLMNKFCPLTDLTFDEWDKLIEINLSSAWKILKEIQPLIEKSSRPKIFFFSNSEISSGKPFFHAFSVARAGIETLAKVYQEERKNFSYHVETIKMQNLKAGVFNKNYFNKDKKKINKEINEKINYITNLVLEKK